jgi:HAD superfamily hydrolase (TIGR01549 family)
VSATPAVPLTAVLFDFGGTLDSDGIPWKARFFRLWSQEIGSVEPERFDRAFYEADDALVGNLPADLPLADTARRLAAGLASGLSAGRGNACERVASRFCEEAREHLAASAHLLERLASRYRLAVVSNFYGNLAAVCAEAGLPPAIAAAIDSAAVGAEKPDPRIFEAALRAVGARPSEALFVGDSLARDMAGARVLGMRHAWIAGDQNGDSPSACCPQDTVLKRLADLEQVIA